MVVHYVKRNLLDSYHKQKSSFLLLIFVQAMSVLIILFSYGIFNHYNNAKDEMEGISMYYGLQQGDRKENLSVETRAVKQFYNDVIDRFGDRMDWIYLFGNVDGYQIHSSHKYRNNRFGISKVVKQQYLPISGVKGRYFTDDEMNNGAKVYYLVTDSLEDEVGSEKVIFGEKYTLVGKVSHEVLSRNNVHFIPFPSLPDGKYIETMSVQFLKPLTQREHEEISSLVVKYFGDTFVIPEFDGVNNESAKRVYRSFMFIAVLLTVICVTNYYTIYDYILEKRKRTLAITRICGCKRYQAFLIYMIELVMLSVVVLAIFELIYVKLLLPRLHKVFDYMLEGYTTEFYIEFNIIYIMALLMAYSLLVIRIVTKRPASLAREV